MSRFFDKKIYGAEGAVTEALSRCLVEHHVRAVSGGLIAQNIGAISLYREYAYVSGALLAR